MTRPRRRRRPWPGWRIAWAWIRRRCRRRAKSRTEEALAERAKKGEARQLLMDVILPVLADPSVPDELVGGRLRNEIGMQRLREITSDSWKPLPKDHGRLSELDSSYSYLRQFTPNVLAVIDFQGGPRTAELIEAWATAPSQSPRPAARSQQVGRCVSDLAI